MIPKTFGEQCLRIIEKVYCNIVTYHPSIKQTIHHQTFTQP